MLYLALLRGINVGGGNVIKMASLKACLETAGFRRVPSVLYFSRVTAQASRSLLTRIIGLPIYQRLTIRNWNTTTRLLALMQARGAGD